MSKTRWFPLILCFAIAGGLIAAESTEKKEVKFTAEQQAAADKVQAAGGMVLRVAASTEDLDVLFNLAGKGGVDAALAHVKSLPKVVKLNLAGTDVSDAGLAQIAGLKDLTHLHLEKTKISDAGLAHLKGLANLQYLNLYGTEVGDKGLEQLAGLKNLKKLYVWQSKVTEGGAEALKKQIAGLYVNRGWEAEAPKTPPVAVTPPPATPEGPSIKAQMEKFHKGNDTPLTRALAKKSNPDELKALLASYQEIAKLKPKKGDEASWKAKTAALIAAAELVSKGDAKGIDALKAASDCKACHSVHK